MTRSEAEASDVVSHLAATDGDSQAAHVPDFFVVGQPKSGTTALYQILRQHPGIFMSRVKEPQYLSADLRRRFQPARSGRLPLTLDEYLALFQDSAPGQLAGEASSAYLFSRTAAAAIAELNPEARVVAIFREPASFLRSLHLQYLQDHLENERSLQKAVALEADRARGRHVPRRSYRPQMLQYSRHVRYVEQLSRYHAVLPSDQILTLIYDDYRGDNETTLRLVFEFLGVDVSVPFVPVEANPAVALRSQLLDDAVHRFSVGRGPVSKVLKTGIKAGVGQSARRRLLQFVQSRVVQAPVPPVDDDLMAELRVWLKPEVEHFSEYLGRDLVKLWRYDDV